jgi:hypothetical protein
MSSAMNRTDRLLAIILELQDRKYLRAEDLAVTFEVSKRTYHYKHLQQPLPIKNSEGRFVVEAEGTGSVVVWEAELEVSNPAQEAEMMALIKGYYRQTLESLKQYVEATGD